MQATCQKAEKKNNQWICPKDFVPTTMTMLYDKEPYCCPSLTSQACDFAQNGEVAHDVVIDNTMYTLACKPHTVTLPPP